MPCRRAIVVLLTLAGLVPGSVVREVLFVCAMDGEIHRACCCPAEAENNLPELQRPQCCDIRVVEGSVVPGTTSRAPDLDSAGTSAVLVFFAEPPARAAFARAEPPPAATGPPPALGPPVYIQRCSFLI
jgi:hypothetical protein